MIYLWMIYLQMIYISDVCKVPMTRAALRVLKHLQFLELLVNPKRFLLQLTLQPDFKRKKKTSETLPR